MLARPPTAPCAHLSEELGAVEDMEGFRKVLRQIEELRDPVTLYFNGELPKPALLPTPTESPLAGYGSYWVASSRTCIYPYLSFWAYYSGNSG
jgi:hypothetical protein